MLGSAFCHQRCTQSDVVRLDVALEVECRIRSLPLSVLYGPPMLREVIYCYLLVPGLEFLFYFRHRPPNERTKR